ncbi:sensor histidine kinase [Haliangium ochraceum]|uniref:histidine kinase n=1 Tax=Haliangium ochraceum (strain DSM 14365 / JCM 11303 / SMP-2) TaxID=502025 RepID=D0LJV6_HALO1|nr:ATP-binding protein [Haliangium ochraceum]ACY18463.1 integral membrane sensor signal transduction histidine kinase [Haliangium ochraceum DSM 14365]
MSSSPRNAPAPAPSPEPPARPPASARGSLRLPILAKLILAFALPTTALFSLFAVVAHEVARGDLEAELGTRLSALAHAAALDIRGKYLVDLQPGDEDDRAYLRARRTLDAIREATGVARLYVFDADFSARVDTADTPIGATLFQAELHRHEIERVLGEGAAVSSVLFSGDDGTMYKAGFAPVRASETEDEIVLVLGVDAPAAYFDRLGDLRRSLLFYGLALVIVVMIIAVLVAARITRPVRELATAATRIGKGELSAAVPRTSSDELGILADTMEEMRRELAARDERMQLMLSGIAHEVRNPLGGIELFAGILRDELGPDDERRSHVARIEREIGYLGEVVNAFLEYARRPPLELALIDLTALLADVLELARADAEQRGVRLQLDAPELACHADAGQLRRAVLNLVRNAIQACAPAADTDADGDDDGACAVLVRATRERRAGVQMVCIAVENPGPPLPDEVRARMFEPFFTTREKGTGLGLALVREIAEDHGGEVEVRSEDGRTVFSLWLVRDPAA